jgi:methionine sulfoxide reductase heme-binding subunit
VIKRDKTAHEISDTPSPMNMNMIWNDRQGRLSPLKSATLALAVAPALVIAYWFFTGALQPLSLKNAIHLTGDWAIRFLVLTLALTPLQRILNHPKITLIRRMLGVTAFAYALTHFTLYVINVKFDLAFTADEIIHRFYLTIGFVTLLGLTALAATSFDSAMRKLGQKWKMLHRIVYALAALGLFHYYLQSKIDVSAATLMTGLFFLAMTIRLMIQRRISLASINLAVAAVIGAALTAVAEFAWYGLATGINPTKVFAANFTVAHGLRPALIVLLVGLGVAAVVALKNYKAAPRFSRQSASR